VSDNPYRLPRNVVPSRYDLHLEPDLDNATFVGTVAIAVDITEATDSIVLNAIELDVKSATVAVHGHDPLPVTVSLDEMSERCTLSGHSFPAGPAVVHLTFSGILNDKLRGFYRSTFVDAAGVTQTIATTQMQATDCRRGFPCWDEPDFKAVFAARTSRRHLRLSGGIPNTGRQRQGRSHIQGLDDHVELPDCVRDRTVGNHRTH
jgi:puromycin-sensitive aminopeptidase